MSETESTRQKKVARLIQKELSVLFQRESRTLFASAMITVTVVRVSPDLSYARVYLSVFNAKAPEELLGMIKAMKKEIRKRLGDIIKHQLRIVPDLDFFIDDSLDYYERIDNLLKK
jgi:ribosome-binding factor A